MIELLALGVLGLLALALAAQLLGIRVHTKVRLGLALAFFALIAVSGLFLLVIGNLYARILAVPSLLLLGWLLWGFGRAIATPLSDYHKVLEDGLRREALGGPVFHPWEFVSDLRLELGSIYFTDKRREGDIFSLLFRAPTVIRPNEADGSAELLFAKICRAREDALRRKQVIA